MPALEDAYVALKRSLRPGGGGANERPVSSNDQAKAPVVAGRNPPLGMLEICCQTGPMPAPSSRFALAFLRVVASVAIDPRDTLHFLHFTSGVGR